MSPDDPRHGTPSGRRAHYRAGEKACRACADANALYQRRYRKTRELYGDRMVPALGYTRRIHALMRLGWSMPNIAARASMSAQQLHEVTSQEKVSKSVADRIEAAYQVLSMALPSTNTKGERISVAKVRAHAERQGYPPPLAFDDIDDPNEQPNAWQYQASDRVDVLHDLDEVRAGITEACARLKVSREALEKWCERNDHMPLFRRLRDREDNLRQWNNQHTTGAA